MPIDKKQVNFHRTSERFRIGNTWNYQNFRSPTSFNVVNDLLIFQKSEGTVSGKNKPKRLWTETDTEIAKSKVVNKTRG